MIVILVGLVYFQTMLHYTNHHLAPQFADQFVFLQYARQFATGHPFQYNTGDPPTTGATSLLYTLILALGYLVGFKSSLLIGFAILLNWALLAVSAIIVYRIARSLLNEDRAMAAGLLFALSGPLIWGFLCGMDLGLFVILLLAILKSFLSERETGRYTKTVLFASLLSLARPEGLAISLIVGATVLLNELLRRRKIRASQLVLLIPVFLSLGVLLLNYSLTGDFLSSSVKPKLLTRSLSTGGVISVVAKFIMDVVRGIFGGAYSGAGQVGLLSGPGVFAHFAPLALVFAVLAFPLALRELRSRKVGFAVLGMVLLLLGLVLAAPTLFSGVQYHRYIMWVYPIFIIYIVLGLHKFSGLFHKMPGMSSNDVFWGVTIFFLLFSLVSTIWFGVEYGRNAERCYYREIAAGQWIDRNLPEDAKVGASMASIEYYSRRYLIHLSGVCDRRFSKMEAEEMAALSHELFERFEPDDRPDYWVLHESDEDRFSSLVFFREEQPLYETASFSGDELRVFKTDWRLLGRSRPVQCPEALEAIEGLDLIDRLNICDPEDEPLHQYHKWTRFPATRLVGYLNKAWYPGADTSEYVLDSGRPIYGREEFYLKTLPGRELRLVMRTASNLMGFVIRYPRKDFKEFKIKTKETTLNLWVNGRWMKEVRFPTPEQNQWTEQVITIPGHLIPYPRTKVALVGDYLSFYYWAYQ